MTTYIRSGHDVAPDQFEPGIPEEDQARWHGLRYLLSGLDAEAEFGVKRWLAVGARLPLRIIRQEATFLSEDGRELPGYESIHHRNETLFGLGDAAVQARVAPLPRGWVDSLQLHLRLGFTLPTGGTEPNPFELGAKGLPHQHMFFGSGTVDPHAAVELAWRAGPATWVGFGSARTSLYENRHGYRAGTQLSAGAGARFSPLSPRSSFLLQAELYRETPAQWSGALARNSGRTDVMATAGASFTVGRRWQLHGLLKVPVFTRAEGGQLSIPAMLVLGVGQDTGGPAAAPSVAVPGS